jgi:hypothetical protein
VFRRRYILEIEPHRHGYRAVRVAYKRRECNLDDDFENNLPAATAFYFPDRDVIVSAPCNHIAAVAARIILPPRD